MDKPFTSDGCTLVSNLDMWMRLACLEHDWRYWRGGTRRERMLGDIWFLYRIVRRSKYWRRGTIRYVGVRIFAGWFARWVGWLVPGKPAKILWGARWGYGWKWPKYKSDGERSMYSIEGQRPTYLRYRKRILEEA